VTTTELSDVWRREAPHVLAALVHSYGHFDDCEDATQEALLAAATQWPREGVPQNPRGWLIRVAQRRLVDQTRSAEARRRREERSARQSGLDRADVPDPSVSLDDSLYVLLLCCHPALTKASQVALVLRAVSGLTTAQIAAAFLVPTTTMGQRISRAKSTVAQAGGNFPPPAADLWARVASVRHAIALLHTEGHLNSSGPSLTDPGFSAEAVRLARLLVAAAPRDPENAGLLALLLLTQARSRVRTAGDGDLVPLEQQDRSRWDADLITEGVRLLEQALPVGPVGEFQLQASIAAVHAEAASWAETDWPQILELYRMLDAVAPSQAVTIGRAVAEARVHGPEAGLATLDALAEGDNHRVHATRGHLLAESGRQTEAVEALRIAARLTRSIPEQRYINQMMHRLETTAPGRPRSRLSGPFD
jgi:RNA polymerase sigma factor (sigma-70 family)